MPSLHVLVLQEKLLFRYIHRHQALEASIPLCRLKHCESELSIPVQVWAGTQKLSEHALIDTPVAIASFISDTSTRQPSLAVAAGSHIFIYRNLRPYYKFVLPPEEVNSEEQETW